MNTFQPIHFVTGKGGVGKSVVAAALAEFLSRNGKKVLLVELGDHSFYKSFFGLEHVGFEAKALKKNWDLAIWNTQNCLRQYVSFYVKIKKIYDLFFENKIMREIVNASPALKELALLGKVTSGIRKVGPALDYDHIVVDAYSTGHFKALLMAPKGMSHLFREGPMGYHSKKITEVITNPKMCQTHIVFKPEDLPTVEAIELYDFLEKEFKMESNLIANQVIEFPTTRGLEIPSYRKAVDFFDKLSSEQDRNLKRMNQIKKIKSIPFYFKEQTGLKLIEEVSSDL